MIEKMNSEINPITQATFILKLQTKRSLSQSLQASLTELLKSSDTLVVFAASQTLTLFMRDKTLISVDKILEEILENPKTIEADYSKIDYIHRDVITDACNCICLLGYERSHKFLPQLTNILDRYSASTAIGIARAILYILSSDDKFSRTIFLANTSEQREVLRSIAHSRRAWRYGKNMSDILSHFSLPNSKEDFLKFVS